MRRPILACLPAALALIACGAGTDATPPAPGRTLASPLARDLAPELSPDEQAVFTEGRADFAAEIYRQSAGEPGNVLVSPHSISLALAMTYGGARGTTADEMAEALRFSLPHDRQHAGFNALDLALSTRGEGAKASDGGPLRFRIANSVFAQEDHPIEDDFLDLLALNYGAGVQLMDFIGQAEQERVTINRWIADVTEEKIPELLPDGSIDGDTRFVLVNAMYLNAAWKHAFDEAQTRNEPFHLLEGDTAEVPMMRKTADFRHAAGDGWTAAGLSYDDEDLEMVVILPEAGTFESFEADLDGERLLAVFRSLSHADVELTMPRFTFGFDASLKEALEAMGMKAPFSGGADFSGIDGERRLFIEDVVHETFIDVMERGTEAAAATGVVVGVESAIQEPVTFTADRPFLFAIRDVPTDTVLFLGRVVDPR